MLLGFALLQLQGNCFRVKCPLGIKELHSDLEYHGSSSWERSHCTDPVQILKSVASKHAETQPSMDLCTLCTATHLKLDPNLVLVLSYMPYCVLSLHFSTFPTWFPASVSVLAFLDDTFHFLPPGWAGPLSKFSFPDSHSNTYTPGPIWCLSGDSQG